MRLLRNGTRITCPEVGHVGIIVCNPRECQTIPNHSSQTWRRIHAATAPKDVSYCWEMTCTENSNDLYPPSSHYYQRNDYLLRNFRLIGGLSREFPCRPVPEKLSSSLLEDNPSNFSERRNSSTGPRADLRRRARDSTPCQATSQQPSTFFRL